MTQEEKAKELVEKFRQFSGDYRTGTKSSYENANQCALVCCDEILSVIDDTWCGTYKRIRFWQQVKQSIIQSN